MRELPEGWVETTLGKSIDIYSGKTRPKQQGAYPVYGGNGILNYGDKFNQEGETIIVGRVGAYCGNVFYETQPFWLSDNALGVKAKETSYEKFLYYKLVSMKLNNHAIGGAQPLLTQTLLKELEINLPPLPEQKTIADMLSSFDEKIELLREQNKTLETLAQTIFKEWFVHFNYPDATGEMVDSELGEIPKGWRVGKLSDIADFLNGLALQKYPPIKGKETLPVIKIRELKQGATVQTDRANTELNKKYIINNGDILFSWSGSLEVVIWKYGQGALNQHLFKVSSETYSKWFYYYWTLFHLREFRSIAANKATTMGHIQRKHLDEAKVLISSDDIMNQGTALFTPMIEKIIITNEQIQTLSKSRDTLLPKLMSGQVRV